MVTPIEIGLLLVVLVVLGGAYLLLKALKPLFINAVIGLVVLALAGWLGYGVALTPIVILLVAFGGIPAAILVLALAEFGIVFQPALIPPLL